MDTQQETVVPTAAADWKGRIQVDGTDLVLPSGNVARVKPVSPTVFLSSGIIPDPLTAMIRQAIHSKQGLPPSKLEKMLSEPTQLRSTMEMFDRVLAEAVLMPHVEMPPTCTECGEYNVEMQHGEDTHEYEEGPRDPQVLYADEVDLQDKIFIFQWCLGGTRDLEQFRQEQQATVGTLSNGKDVRSKAKRPARRR
jgi:hypothetical protein